MYDNVQIGPERFDDEELASFTTVHLVTVCRYLPPPGYLNSAEDHRLQAGCTAIKKTQRLLNGENGNDSQGQRWHQDDRSFVVKIRTARDEAETESVSIMTAELYQQFFHYSSHAWKEPRIKRQQGGVVARMDLFDCASVGSIVS